MQPCPLGADCTKHDGVKLEEVVALPGYYRPSFTSDTFVSCKQGYTGLDAGEKAITRCCPMHPNLNTSICRSLNASKNTNLQCAEGYTGLLCLQCATDFVNRNGFCESCPGGASFLYALFPMLSACLLLYILVTMLLLCHCCQSKNSVTAKATENRTKLKRVQKYFGQIKILISLLQIIASMPLVLVGVDFSVFFQQMAQAFNLFNLDMLSLTTALGCQVSVRFFSSFIINDFNNYFLRFRVLIMFL